MQEKFKEDLQSVMRKLPEGLDNDAGRKLNSLKDQLVHLHEKNMVKINHSVMELVCARYLILAGYDVEVERFLDGISCDIYAIKGLGSLIVEVETGFVPPDHALDPFTYCKARIVSKITRYSGFAEKFALAAPPYYIIPIPQVLIKPPRYRTEKEMKDIKSLCDLYYHNPPVSPAEIKNARLHTVYVVDVDKVEVKETDPVNYIERCEQFAY